MLASSLPAFQRPQGLRFVHRTNVCTTTVLCMLWVGGGRAESMSNGRRKLGVSNRPPPIFICHVPISHTNTTTHHHTEHTGTHKQ